MLGAGIATLLMAGCLLGAGWFHVFDGKDEKGNVHDNSKWIYSLWFGAAAFAFIMGVGLGFIAYIVIAMIFYGIGCYWKSKFYQRNPHLDSRVKTMVQ
jgi:hypothetical protein